MFTGIIEELGEVQGITKRGKLTLLSVKAIKVLEETKVGDSIAVNGVCLTVIKKDKEAFCFEVIGETSRITNLQTLRVADKVNLERSLKIGDRLSGHFVQGHIDCLGIIRKKSFSGDNLAFEIAVPAEFIKYCIPKGSIAVDGISLTLTNIKSSSFILYVIPHTLKNTTLKFKGPSSKVNIEFDILVKKA